MGMFEDLLKGSWGTALVGIGVALVAPTVLPAVGEALRPLAKSLIKGGVMLYDTAKEAIAEAGEQVNDMVEEARAEVEEESEDKEATPSRKARSRKGSD